MKYLLVLFALTLVVAACSGVTGPGADTGQNTGPTSTASATLAAATPLAPATEAAQVPAETATAAPTEIPQTGGTAAATPAATGVVSPTAALVLATATQAPVTPGAAAGSIPVTMRASQLLDFPVRTVAGGVIGDVEDVVVDLSRSDLQYVVVDIDDLLGVGDRTILVPIEAFLSSTAASQQGLLDPYALYLNIDQNNLINGPMVDTDLLNISVPNWDASYLGYWQSLLPPPDPSQVQPTPPAISQAGRPQAALLKELLDAKVLNTAGNLELGDIEDALISTADGQVKYLVVEVDQLLGERLVPVPLSVLSVVPDISDPGEVDVMVDQTRLQNAPSLDLNALMGTNNPDWDLGVREYWQIQ